LVQFEGDPYEQGSNAYHQMCLAAGSYNFTIFDSFYDGLNELEDGEYTLSISNQVFEEYYAKSLTEDGYMVIRIFLP